MGMKFRGFTVFKPVLHQVQVVQNLCATVFWDIQKVQLLDCFFILLE